MGSVGGKMGEKEMRENLQGFPNKNRLVGGFKHIFKFVTPIPWEDDPISRKKNRVLLAGGNSNIFYLIIPKIGGNDPILTVRIFFQLGWFNHQLEIVFLDCLSLKYVRLEPEVDIPKNRTRLPPLHFPKKTAIP